VAQELWLIDHGAAFFYQHNWSAFSDNAKNPFKQIKDHILLKFAGEIKNTDAEFSAKLTPEVLRSIVALIPDDWLNDAEKTREIYLDFLLNRLETPREFVKEAIDARAALHV
jgi:hypothetical protein